MAATAAGVRHLIQLLLLQLLLLELPQLCVVVEDTIKISSTEATYSTATARLRLQATTAITASTTTAAADPLLGN